MKTLEMNQTEQGKRKKQSQFLEILKRLAHRPTAMIGLASWYNR